MVFPCLKNLKGESKYSEFQPFSYRSMEICYEWSQGRVNGAWGHFEVNLPKDDE